MSTTSDSRSTTKPRSTANTPPTPRRPRGRFTPASTILVTGLAGFALLVVVTIVAVAASGVEMLSEATSQQLAAVTALVALRNLVYLLVIAYGGLGVALVARNVLGGDGSGRPLALGSLGGVGLSVLAGLASIVVPIVAVGFSEPRWGDTTSFAAYYATSAVAVWAGAAAAGLAALAVRATGIRRGPMLAIAIVSLAYVVVDLTTRGGVPPFGLAFVWLALGINLRASRVPA